jgi:hypothetical protein
MTVPRSQVEKLSSHQDFWVVSNLRMKIIIATPLLSFLICSAVNATDIGQYVGYTIVAKKTIIGYVESDGKTSQSFEGCNFGRKIIFEDNTYLTCSSYNYQYAYRPEAVILVRSGSWKMLVEGNSYDMAN